MSGNFDRKWGTIYSCNYWEKYICSDDEIEFENDQSLNCIFQAGDGYLAGLAARFASEFNLDEDDVLHQLEDLRSVLLR